jgi:hypothetical protein
VSKFIHSKKSKVTVALESALTAVVCLALGVLSVSGLEHFFQIFFSFIFPVLAISLLAGVIRLFFRCGGLLFSMVCGALVGVTGFLAVFLYILSHI